MSELEAIARAMVAKGKGILAADESTGTIERRLKSIGVANTEDNRRGWRQLLFTAPGIGKYISGVILYDETLRQKSTDGVPLVDVLTKQGVIPGIKVDKGTKALAGSAAETITEGLDGLRERLQEYRTLGARFTKWRAVITIGEGIPTAYCIAANAHALARYAHLSQEARLVPMVEPEVLMDGSHSIERCYEVTEATLYAVFNELYAQRVVLEAMVLKPNMVLSGSAAANRAGAGEVAEMTVRCFKRTVPAAVPGVAFLSGGQGDEEATVNLDAINRLPEKGPWELTFSYGRGLQATPMKAWGGNLQHVTQAQQVFLHRAQVTSAARGGAYSPAMEKK
ncbi:MAG: fructose-bisphosphate aldolase class I [Dehalococcoidia bacterium]|nr:fructose-bisphosphate aldolase class I [Dehalococcoidia bacterium]